MPVHLHALSVQIWGQSGEFSCGLPFVCGECLVTCCPAFVCPIQSCTETGLGRGEEKGIPRGEVLTCAPICMSRGTSDACLVVCMKWSWGDVNEWWVRVRKKKCVCDV